MNAPSTRAGRAGRRDTPTPYAVNIGTAPRRIVGVAADIDDENVVPGPAMSIYPPLEQGIGGGRIFVHASADPYSLVTPITRIIRELSSEQPVERAATLDEIAPRCLPRSTERTCVRRLRRQSRSSSRSLASPECWHSRSAHVRGVRRPARDRVRTEAPAHESAQRGSRDRGCGRRHWRDRWAALARLVGT